MAGLGRSGWRVVDRDTFLGTLAKPVGSHVIAEQLELGPAVGIGHFYALFLVKSSRSPSLINNDLRLLGYYLQVHR